MLYKRKGIARDFLHFHHSLILLSRRVEELGTGAAYCQLLDILFPGENLQMTSDHIWAFCAIKIFDTYLLVFAILFILVTGQVPISRVKFDPKQESDCLDNFKMICSTFNKLNVDKVMPRCKIILVARNLFLRVWMLIVWSASNSKTTSSSCTGSRSSLTKNPREGGQGWKKSCHKRKLKYFWCAAQHKSKSC